MKRGEVWWVDFGPSRGGEIQKRRPAVILTNDAAIPHLNRLQVVPFTSQTQKLYPSEARVRLKGAASKAMADQVMTVAKERLVEKFTTLARADLAAVEEAVRRHLGL